MTLIALLLVILFHGNITCQDYDYDDSVSEMEEDNSMITVLEFPFDSNDSNTFATSRTVLAQNALTNFTVCFSFMVGALRSSSADNGQLIRLEDNNGKSLAEVNFKVEYDIETFYESYFSVVNSSEVATYFWVPAFTLMTWMQSCVTLRDGTATITIDGNELDGMNPPSPFDVFDGLGGINSGNFTLTLGQGLTGSIANVNMFFPALSPESMADLTSEGEECGIKGNLTQWGSFLSREEMIKRNSTSLVDRWSLFGRTVFRKVAESDGPCQRQKEVIVFTSEYRSSYDCMEHCKKLGTRSPPVKTSEELERLKRELEVWIPDIDDENWFWLSVTKGRTLKESLLRLDHWPDEEVATKGIWRDYYTGKQLDNYTKPWGDGEYGDCVACGPYDFYNPTTCLDIFHPAWCPCEVGQPTPFPPLLLRGLCSSSNLRSEDFTRGVWYTPHQLTSDIKQIFYVGGMSTRIDYDKQEKKWILKDVPSNTSAISLSRHSTYVLGKHNWTVGNDNLRCHDEKGEERDNKNGGYGRIQLWMLLSYDTHRCEELLQ